MAMGVPDRQWRDRTDPIAASSAAYTAEAMRARLQGMVILNWWCGPTEVLGHPRPIARHVFGLDQQAIASAREWFRPGMSMGEWFSVPRLLHSSRRERSTTRFAHALAGGVTSVPLCEK